MATSRLPVVVIGAGVSGLVSIKACREENLPVVCFEKTNCLGGLWVYRETTEYGVASVMRSTIINSSKEISAFSDFPPAEHLPNFMHNSQMARYIRAYAERFDLEQHIKFFHEVTKVKKADDFQRTGEWIVTTKSREGKEESLRASAVMVCTGHHVFPHSPELKGLGDFKGEVVHTHGFKDSEKYARKNVVVIGIGNSGGDVAVELHKLASQVYLSTRRGSWVTNRVGLFGTPLDILLLRRALHFLQQSFPFGLVNSVMEFQVNQKFDHDLYQLKPQHRFFSQHIFVNDDLPNCIASGSVAVKGDVDHFTENGVVFQGEPGVVNGVDAVVMATGYYFKFPFLDESIVGFSNNEMRLYKLVFPPENGPSTLAFIGYIQPLGAIMPISELQARWAVQVFQEKTKLPSKSDMLDDIQKYVDKIKSIFYDSPRHTIQVDAILYLDELARLAGTRPNFLKLLFTDPALFKACIFGPFVPYQFRLTGPHTWSGARKAILEVPDRVKAPFQKQVGKHGDVVREKDGNVKHVVRNTWDESLSKENGGTLFRPAVARITDEQGASVFRYVMFIAILLSIVFYLV